MEKPQPNRPSLKERNVAPQRASAEKPYRHGKNNILLLFSSWEFVLTAGVFGPKGGFSNPLPSRVSGLLLMRTYGSILKIGPTIQGHLSRKEGHPHRGIPSFCAFILSATRIPPGLLSGKVFWSYCMHRWYCFLLMR